MAQRLPVQRKTASLNKENRQRGFRSPPQPISSDRRLERTKVLGSHQRQNTDRPAAAQTDQQALRNKAPHEREVKAPSTVEPDHDTPQGCGTKQGGTLQAPKRNHGEAGEKSSRPAKTEPQPSGGDLPQEVFELSLQEKVQRWECDRHTESMELGEFELLEQAAEELSFSSNSSFVTKVRVSFFLLLHLNVGFGTILAKLRRFLWPSRVCSLHVDPADGPKEGRPRASTTPAVLHSS